MPASPQCQCNVPGASRLKPLIRTEGERALYELNRASLLYDMKKFREAADVIVEIPALNPEFDARCASLRTKIMNAMTPGTTDRKDREETIMSLITEELYRQMGIRRSVVAFGESVLRRIGTERFDAIDAMCRI